MNIKTVGIWVNDGKPDALKVSRVLRETLLARGVRVESARQGFEHCDVLAVLGGDGTLLSAMDEALPHSLPIWGVNAGHMGFLCETEPDYIEQDLERLLNGAYRMEERMLLEAELPDGRRFCALNELVVTRAADCMRILRMEVLLHGEPVERFAGDGLIVSTPTGSTAYSFSAGGPVVAPGMSLMLLTPICPHTPNTRPAVLPPDATLQIFARGPGDAQAALDGRMVFPLEANDCLTVRRSRQTLRFIRLHERNFFDLLHGKLMIWGK